MVELVSHSKDHPSCLTIDGISPFNQIDAVLERSTSSAFILISKMVLFPDSLFRKKGGSCRDSRDMTVAIMYSSKPYSITQLIIPHFPFSRRNHFVERGALHKKLINDQNMLEATLIPYGLNVDRCE